MVQDLDAELAALKQRQADLKAELDTERNKLQAIQRKKKRLLDNQIRRTQHRLSTVERKRDTRKKILAGSWLLTVSQQDQVLALRFRNDLDGFLERDRDRELFGLSPRPKDS